jgi:hypothetical protein
MSAEWMVITSTVFSTENGSLSPLPCYSRTPSGETGHPIRFPCACEIPQAALFS